jgi:FixJ family two-component response regulator
MNRIMAGRSWLNSLRGFDCKHAGGSLTVVRSSRQQKDDVATPRHAEFAMTTRPLVSIVDDDQSVRESLPDLLGELGFAVQVFSSGEEFLASDWLGRTQCLILDIAMPGMTGPELQQELKRRGLDLRIVFITAHGDESIRPVMLERGAVECLFKPFSDTALLGAINAACRLGRL